MWKENRLIRASVIGIASLGVVVIIATLSAKFFFGSPKSVDYDDSHLPQQARDALVDIAVVAKKLDGVQLSSGQDEVQAIRNSLEAMASGIRQLPSENDFSYGQLLQAEIAQQLERCSAVRRRGLLKTGEFLESNPAEDAQRLESLATEHHQIRLSTADGDRNAGMPIVIEIRTQASPAMMSLEGELEQLRKEVERQRALQQQQILETEYQLDLPEVEKLLVAFTTPGLTYTTPDGKKNQNDGTARPVSLTFLKKYGCLKSNRKSLEKLLSAASRCQRPRGALPRQWDGSMLHLDLGMNTVQRAEELLLKYGELLVEKGMLSP